MKKIIPILMLLFILMVGNRAQASTGVGIYAGYPLGFGLTLKINNFPVIGASWNFAAPAVGVTLDYWVLNNSISQSIVYWYVGLGGFVNIGANNGGHGSFGAGLRIPIGLQIFPASQFEIFLEGVPAVPLIPSPTLDIQAAIGLRVYFK